MTKTREELERLAQEADARKMTSLAEGYREEAARAGGLDGAALAARQRQAALERSAQDHSGAPRWPWTSLHTLAGPLLGGDLVVIGARPGAGKTTFALNAAQHFTECGYPWLYIGQEMAPEQLRRKWSAMRLGYPAPPVLRNEWDELPAGARESVDADVMQQTSPPLVNLAHFADARRLDAMGLVKWVQFAVSRGCRIVILDHIHRLQHGLDASALTYETAEAVRTCKEQAVKHQLTMLVAAQLNRGARDPVAEYLPPPLSALKQTGALEEEADVALLLHRTLKRSTTRKDLTEVRFGRRPVAEVVESNVMSIRIGKHRLDGAATDRTTWLVVDPTGRLTERAPDWRVHSDDTVEDRYGM
jgi:replicative DNA helicase